MISLRRAMEAQVQDALESTLRVYRAALGLIGDVAARAFPSSGESFRESLATLQKRLAQDATPELVDETGRSLEVELNAWGDQAAKFYKEKTTELKEILGIVAQASSEIAERDDRYSQQFTALTERLREASRLSDLATIRETLSKSVTELNTCVTGMAKAGQDSLGALKAKLSTYQQRLFEAERLASMDAVTGLANRRQVESTLEAWIKEGRKFSVLYLDLNGFKQINDTYGHGAGDELLKQFAKELRAVFRPSDEVGRWGGDEFLVAVSGDLKEAQNFATRIEKWVNGQYTLASGAKQHKIQLAAAIGISGWNAGESLATLVRNADEAMYRNKKQTKSLAR
jgi:diguanylate cyclase (GGDEF)-like protein